MNEGKFKDIQVSHQELLIKFFGADSDETPDYSEIKLFLERIASAGNIVESPEQRSNLRALIRYWASFLHDKTGQFPVVELQPFDDSIADQDNTQVPDETELNPPQDGPVHPLLPFEKLGSYKLIEKIGDGGFSSVYKARSLEDGNIVAIKIFSKEKLKASKFYGTLLENEKSAQEFEHPNIIKIHEVSEINNFPYLVMDYIAEGSLADRISEWFWRPKLQDILDIGKQIMSGLHYLHRHGVVHRDIKPGNILLDQNNHVYIADFGVSQLIEQVYTDVVVGTPAYLAPETILHPDQVSEKTDIPIMRNCQSESGAERT